ncbi:hypothetical protein D5S17_22990 [Pseudonocardiaceae bacterium YIM PH 21723]|nr:hypothetical protein D5S17_22990 [Pseudonocardiaceae bacterium YIM PH 21723]
MIGHAVATPSRRGLALLRGMATVLPDETTARAASVAADALVAGGLPEPSWAAALGELKPGDCWHYDATETGHTMVVATYWYGDTQHALSLLIDHMMGGVAKNLIATFEIEKLLASATLAPISQDKAHELMAQAYELTYKYPQLHVDPDVHRFRFLVHRRLNRL